MRLDAGNVRHGFVHSIWMLAAGAFATWIYFTSGSELDWDCSPIDPSYESLPDNPCFRATLDLDNKVTLEWRVENVAVPVYIFDDIGPGYQDIGFRESYCPEALERLCRYSFRVEQGGEYRWTLGVSDNGGESRSTLFARASLTVPGPYPPAVTSDESFVDVLAPSSRTITWTADPRNDQPDEGEDPVAAWIEVKPPAKLFWNSARFPRTGPEAYYEVAAAALRDPGNRRYLVRDCYQPSDSSTAFCSPAATAGFYTGGDHFLGPHVIHVDAGTDVDLAFTARSGNARQLLMSSFTGSAGRVIGIPYGGQMQVPGELLVPGAHRVRLDSCLLPLMQCSSHASTVRADLDGFLFQMQDSYYQEGAVIALLYPLDGSPGQVIRAPATGLVQFAQEAAFNTVMAGGAIATVATRPDDEVHILVDSPVEWEVGRHYSADFASAIAHPIIGAGEPLDITFDNSGGIWTVNEFSNSVEHVSPAARIESVEVPLGRSVQESASAFPAVRPFTVQLGQPSIRGHTSTLAERITPVGSQIWFTQGGGFIEDYSALPNHSRVVAVDPTLSDLPNTRYDDRLCVYNLPADDAAGFGNNQAIGLAAVNGRIWVAESRGLIEDRPSIIASFLPDPSKCDNLLDFENPEALAHQALQYCTNFTTPEQDGCIERYSLDKLVAGIKVAHLEADPADSSIWFTDAHGQYLGNLNTARADVIRLFPIPNTHSGAQDNLSFFGGFPWSLKVNEGAVYFTEFSTRHILRYDKASGDFDEIYVPYISPQALLHSIAIDRNTNRLWFTIANEAPVPLEPAASTIGYIDLNSWREHINDPDSMLKIRAVLYRGLEDVTHAAAPAETRYSFRGITLDPASGRIALATMWRRQVTELHPRPGF